MAEHTEPTSDKVPTVVTYLRLPVSLRTAAQEAANAAGVNITTFVIEALQDRLNRD